MSNIRECTFNSVWDGESVVISTEAKIDLESGRIFDIEAVDGTSDDGAEVETLDRMYIDFVGINGEFEVEDMGNREYRADDISAVLTALAPASAARGPKV